MLKTTSYLETSHCSKCVSRYSENCKLSRIQRLLSVANLTLTVVKIWNYLPRLLRSLQRVPLCCSKSLHINRTFSIENTIQPLLTLSHPFLSQILSSQVLKWPYPIIKTSKNVIFALICIILHKFWGKSSRGLTFTSFVWCWGQKQLGSDHRCEKAQTKSGS